MIWLYDGGWEGLLTAVFLVFAQKDDEASICPQRRFPGASLFPVHTVAADPARAGRVARGMARLSPELPRVAYRAFLSERPAFEDALLGTLRLGFAGHTDPLPLRHLEPVRQLHRFSEEVSRELVLFMGIIRLVHAGGDLYAADIEPDTFVLPLLGRHFHGRFGAQRLIIRDLKRRLALVSTPEEWLIAALPDGPLPPLPEDRTIGDMWRAYFAAIANPARRNPALQRRFVPTRYRLHITEFQNLPPPDGTPPAMN
ncbi:MAG: TIGR03915 family putative DNA repair protein [Oscillospiraceae bacterium]|jgi:probable DNA metabolism protein|nr:TIGR03915 family putative DNA repair protein [Oscillospiraceae bacterium]